MPDLVKPPHYKVGDKVQLKFGTPFVGTVTEVRRTYTPGGHHFYRIRIPMDPEPLWPEAREDEIELVRDEERVTA